MTAAKIDSMTACRWPGCTSSVYRRGLCVRDYSRAQVLIREGAHWSDDPRVWVALWEDRAVRVKAKRRATGLRNLHQTQAPAPAPTATPEPDRSAWPVLVKRTAGDYEWPTSGRGAIICHGERKYVAWFDEEFRTAGTFPAAQAAADAIRARLPDEVGEANSSLAEEAKPAPRVERCAETSTNRGERCIKALVDGAAHEGLHMFVVGDTTQGLGEHRPQADAIRARPPEDVPATKALPSSLSTPKGPDPRDAEIADLRSQVEAFRRAACVATGCGEDATPGDARLLDMLREAVPRELAALRAVVREAMEACDRAGVHEGLTPAERIDVLVCQHNLADHALADARERLGRARERWEKNDAEIAQLRGAVLDADERMLRAVDGVATTGARLRDALKEIAGISDTDPTTHADEVIIERAKERAGKALHYTTSLLLSTLAQTDEVEVLAEVYNIDRDCDADLDNVVYAWIDAGCPDAGNDIDLDRDGVTPPEAVDIAELDGRARRAEAELDKLREHLAARTKDRDSLEAAWDAARTDAARLRAAIADVLDIDGQVPPDDELVRRLRDLDGGQDLAVVRKVIGTCTTTIRKVVCEEKDAVSIAVDGLCEVIETTVGVRS